MTAYEIRNLYKGKGRSGEGEWRDKGKISEKKKETYPRYISLEIRSSLILSLFSVSVEIYYM